MPEGAFYQPKRGNPTALTVVILLHGAAITALAMAKMEVIAPEKFGVPDIFDVYTPPPPPPNEPPKEVKVELPRTPPVYVPPRPFDTPLETPTLTTTPEPQPFYPSIDRGPVIQVEPSPPPPPPPPPAKKVEPARAKANLASYVSDADYPSSAIRSEEQGTTRFRLTVGTDGRVTDCTVTGSSGSSALDTATCRIMKNRAKFTPARNSEGQATSDSVSSAIRWVLPEG